MEAQIYRMDEAEAGRSLAVQVPRCHFLSSKENREQNSTDITKLNSSLTSSDEIRSYRKQYLG